MPLLVPELFVLALGLAIGSFLNVVIYRMPLGISIARPQWSFCPSCRQEIRWYDNLPVISWLALRGRCRHCRTPISVQYPVVEALTGAIFVAIFHLLFVADVRDGVLPGGVLARDWPYLLVWLTLAATLIACSAMDIVSYSLDIRLMEFTVGAACLFHAIWRYTEFHQPVSDSAAGAAAAAAFFVMIPLLWRTVWFAAPPVTDEELSANPPTAGDDVEDPHAGAASEDDRPPTPIGILSVLLFIVLAVGLAIADSGLVGSAALQNAAGDILFSLILITTFTAMVFSASLQREADEEIHDEIEAEAENARGMAFAEIRWLLPLIVASVVGYFAVARVPAVESMWQVIVSWEPRTGLFPIAGLVFAMHGAIVGAAAGWFLRIFFTLVFGREAFGVGDIYILAAAGAAAGWDIALFGLLFAIAIAMASWMLSQFFKNSIMIPFGPPLALGFLVALWLNKPSAAIANRYGETLQIAMREQPQLMWIFAGIMLIGFGAAILAAKMVRRAVEGPADDA